MQKNRIPLLKNLWISHTGIGHMALDSTCPIPVRTSTTSTSNCFIIAKSIIPKSEIIHATLRTSTGLKGSKYNICYPLRCENITSNNCSLFTWREERAFRNMDSNRG
ncbi:hypothetical protein OIU79_022561 [Salix purpurea]|uniref:Uncharacterized protein n=1 Tax=Salix purpurea TaxID=77065 RepID=A0A9Q0WH41_SALPP|nr:hypothetical protein OIU79_022561 [Salix purpurea]